MDFTGSKIALIDGEKVILLMRDEKPGIPFPGMLDFPGGGREGNESPVECVIREVREELGIELNEDSILWKKQYPSTTFNGLVAWFFVASISRRDIDEIVFGGEGQYWGLMSIDEYLSHLKGIPQQKAKLKDFVDRIAANDCENSNANQSEHSTPRGCRLSLRWPRLVGQRDRES